LKAHDSSTRRFVEFCEADGFEWDEAGLRAMLAWLSLDVSLNQHYWKDRGTIREQCERGLCYHGAPPAKPAGSWRLYHDVRMALAGFTKARLEGGDEIPSATYRPQPK
jgi:hypothetical protein